MRTSKVELIVDAALAVLDSDGVEGLTFEAVAARAGLTRGGVVYHFATREALVEGMADRLLASWKGELLSLLGGPAEEATPAERIVALVRSGIEGVVRPGELVFLLSGFDAATRAGRAWDRFCEEWIGPLDLLTPGQRVALVAADGYWANLAVGSGDRNPRDEETIALMLRLAAGESE